MKKKEIKERTLTLLKEAPDISAYSFVISQETSKEAFFVKDKLDMNRSKDVFHTRLTIYKDFEADGKKYRGSAVCKISPQDTDDVIKHKIKDALFAAGFVKNEWYPIPKPSASQGTSSTSSDSLPSPFESLLKMQKAIYSEERMSKESPPAYVNSAEFFVTNSFVEVVNSEGVDVSFAIQKNEVEVITDAKGDEDVEIYGYEAQGEISEDALKERLQEQLTETSWRAVAKKASHIPSINIILKGDSVAKFFQFYKTQTSSSIVYSGQSRAKIGENFQGDVKGDKVSITLDPLMKGSPNPTNYDTSGLPLEKVTIFDEGVVKTYHGDSRFAHYLQIKPTGIIENMDVSAGSLSYENMKAKPYVEILMFSDFFMDQTTGNFGGEFRLARWFDGKDMHIITAGSIQGNMFSVQGNMFLSKEIIQKSEYRGPKAVLLPDMEIVG